ncbi:bZIP transcription factor (Atf21), putative [Paecilomyces variotii No. 5]|uniref:BZIP transcription factor (Atf21), putative n=1 Tax=Byssochlamys spectabilis (strain No. 5 / NBRC 109023) TaxID=1356009 RepID=V5FPY9_BYSSN|nr:bZIP transcription factor (Atf21), putative [Paecilomyces variotii No. 5]
MSAPDMSPEPALVGTNMARPIAFDSEAFHAGLPSDFLDLLRRDDDANVWGLDPMSLSLPGWSSNDQLLSTPDPLPDQQSLKVGTGQTTPLLYYDQSTSSSIEPNSWDDPKMAEMVGNLRQSSMGNRSRVENHKSKRVKLYNSRSSQSNVSGNRSNNKNNKQANAKHEKFLLRNRLAANKSRQKKKDHTMMLKAKCKEQSDHHEKLTTEIARLRPEILELKNEVLQHAKCGNGPIDLHLVWMVHNIRNDAITHFKATLDGENVADGIVSSLVN